MNERLLRDIFTLVSEIDFNTGYHYYLCNIDNYSKALLSTLKSIKSKLPLLRNMIDTKEYEGLRMITQTLRRMMGSIGGTPIVDRSYHLEVALLNQDDDFNEILIEYLIDLEDLTSRMEELVKRLGLQHIKEDLHNQDSYFEYDYTKTRESIKLSADFIEKKII